jgi:1,4-alpha-glucan branching enzyme
MTFATVYAWSENFILPISHDEVVHGKGALAAKIPGDRWRRMATVRALLAFMWAHPGRQLLFMGCELGEWREWMHDDSLDWDLLRQPLHAGLHRFVCDVNHLYRTEAALHEVDFEPAGFSWIDCNDFEASVISFIRRARDPRDFVAIVVNWTPVARHDYRIGVPEPGFYRELLNSDADLYGGGNVGNQGGLETEPVAAHGHAQSLRLTVPPLAGLIFKKA